jgi:hypothetical protein
MEARSFAESFLRGMSRLNLHEQYSPTQALDELWHRLLTTHNARGEERRHLLAPHVRTPEDFEDHFRSRAARMLREMRGNQINVRTLRLDYEPGAGKARRTSIEQMAENLARGSGDAGQREEMLAAPTAGGAVAHVLGHTLTAEGGIDVRGLLERKQRETGLPLLPVYHGLAGGQSHAEQVAQHGHAAMRAAHNVIGQTLNEYAGLPGNRVVAQVAGHTLRDVEHRAIRDELERRGTETGLPLLQTYDVLAEHEQHGPGNLVNKFGAEKAGQARKVVENVVNQYMTGYDPEAARAAQVAGQQVRVQALRQSMGAGTREGRFAQVANVFANPSQHRTDEQGRPYLYPSDIDSLVQRGRHFGPGDPAARRQVFRQTLDDMVAEGVLQRVQGRTNLRGEGGSLYYQGPRFGEWQERLRPFLIGAGGRMPESPEGMARLMAGHIARKLGPGQELSLKDILGSTFMTGRWNAPPEGSDRPMREHALERLVDEGVFQRVPPPPGSRASAYLTRGPNFDAYISQAGPDSLVNAFGAPAVNDAKKVVGDVMNQHLGTGHSEASRARMAQAMEDRARLVIQPAGGQERRFLTVMRAAQRPLRGRLSEDERGKYINDTILGDIRSNAIWGAPDPATGRHPMDDTLDRMVAQGILVPRTVATPKRGTFIRYYHGPAYDKWAARLQQAPVTARGHLQARLADVPRGNVQHLLASHLARRMGDQPHLQLSRVVCPKDLRGEWQESKTPGGPKLYREVLQELEDLGVYRVFHGPKPPKGPTPVLLARGPNFDAYMGRAQQ